MILLQCINIIFILANSDQNNHKEIQVLNTLLSKQVDGILYMGNNLTPELRAEIVRSKTPIVLDRNN